jgi:triacylglycerol lipase
MFKPAARAISAAAVELGWIAAHVATYPLGLIRDAGDRLDPRRLSVSDLPPGERGLFVADVAAASTPVLLVHGIVDNRTIFVPLRRSLRRRGFHSIQTFSYGPHTTDVRETAARLAVVVEQMCEESGSERVFIIGHSLGGLIARYYVQRLEGHRRVDTLITLGSPHEGTLTAELFPHRLVRQLRTRSDLIEELREPAPDCDTRFLAVYSEVDHLIVPARNGAISHPDLHAENLGVPATGHLSLPINGRVIHRICTTLAHVRAETINSDRSA